MTDIVALTPQNFWNKRTTKDVLKKKEELVQLLCFYHTAAIKRREKFGTAEFQISLLSLRSMVRDYQPAFDFFFEVVKKGYRFSADEKELTTVLPKSLGFTPMVNYDYVPESKPETGIFSTVQIRKDPTIINDLLREGLFHLIPKIKFLLDGPSEMQLAFEPTGELGLRDTSTWPIPAIETWPSWVRSRVFGGGVDIKSAYIQFAIEAISAKYESRSRRLFDKIFILWENPELIRHKISEILQVDYQENKKAIKGIIMAVAMGSKVSQSLVFHDVSFSRCATLINKIQPNLTEAQAQQLADLLTPISVQFKLAKKTVNIGMDLYFKWERDRRYVLWEEADRRGIMMHDGLDGLPDDAVERICSGDLGFEISKS